MKFVWSINFNELSFSFAKGIHDPLLNLYFIFRISKDSSHQKAFFQHTFAHISIVASC
jgi:hypothetical protein